MAREKKNEQVKVNFNSNNAYLKDQLKELEEKYYGRDDIFGMTALTRIGYISGNRGIMTTGHLKQAMTPINPVLLFSPLTITYRCGTFFSILATTSSTTKTLSASFSFSSVIASDKIVPWSITSCLTQ